MSGIIGASQSNLFMGKRATKIDKQVRIAQFVQMISRGFVNSQLIQHAADEWGVSDRSARDYIAEAREVIVYDVDHERKEVVAQLLHTSQTIIQQAIERGELNNAIGGMNVIIKLGGLEMKP